MRLLLTWARDRKIELSRVTVGSCSVEVAPARQTPASLPKQQARPDPRQLIYAQFGGDAFKQVQDAEFGELEPVVARR